MLWSGGGCHFFPQPLRDKGHNQKGHSQNLTDKLMSVVCTLGQCCKFWKKKALFCAWQADCLLVVNDPLQIKALKQVNTDCEVWHKQSKKKKKIYPALLSTNFLTNTPPNCCRIFLFVCRHAYTFLTNYTLYGLIKKYIHKRNLTENVAIDMWLSTALHPLFKIYLEKNTSDFPLCGLTSLFRNW